MQPAHTLIYHIYALITLKVFISLVKKCQADGHINVL